MSAGMELNCSKQRGTELARLVVANRNKSFAKLRIGTPAEPGYCRAAASSGCTLCSDHDRASR
jgi:hypothetical protein